MNSNTKNQLGKTLPSPTGIKTKVKPQYNPHERRGSRPPNGKKTEREVMSHIQRHYGERCRIDRLPDSLDAGHYEDRRPCDLFVTMQRHEESKENTIWYIECKETGQQSIKLQFSVLNSGQRKAMTHTIQLRIPYFVAFQHLPTKQLWLVPAKVIMEFEERGKKSMNEKDLEPYQWLIVGRLYDNFYI